MSKELQEEAVGGPPWRQHRSETRGDRKGGPPQRHPGLRFGGAAGSGQAVGVGQGWGAEPLPILSAAPSLQGHPGHLGCTRVCTLGHVQRLPQPSWKGTDGSGQRVNDDNWGWNKVHCPNS